MDAQLPVYDADMAYRPEWATMSAGHKTCAVILCLILAALYICMGTMIVATCLVECGPDSRMMKLLNHLLVFVTAIALWPALLMGLAVYMGLMVLAQIAGWAATWCWERMKGVWRRGSGAVGGLRRRRGDGDEGVERLATMELEMGSWETLPLDDGLRRPARALAKDEDLFVIGE
ncbi:hypothetical protein HIM_05116 [Hirsutella minnesotensis 3608]|uniref:Uncharacterized protein n=1 Tax=Hirsutella minnesotensis 3608 TaxID=1043627 RepID=A0A0F7ZPF7_9HYPO|nr:hypothetical protein HIM_05116 [Hirsutella minnesotensis 3608]